LIVEDAADDADRMLRELSRGDFAPAGERVETAPELRRALAGGPWDVVLADDTLPQLDALAALAVVQEADPDLPFVVVSGTVGEERAVATLRAGASDFLLKDSLARLPAAVERSLRQAENRRARRRAERAAFGLAALVESSEDAIISQTLDGVVTSWNPAAERLYGWSAAEALGRHIDFLVPPDKQEELAAVMALLRRGERVRHLDTVRLHREGARMDVSLTISPVRDADGRLVGVSKIVQDARERKQAARSLRQSEERFRAFMDHSPALAWITDTDGRMVYASATYLRTLRLPPGPVEGRTLADLFPPALAETYLKNLRAAAAAGRRLETFETGERADGSVGEFLVYTFPLPAPDGGPPGPPLVGGVAADLTEQRRAEEALRLRDRAIGMATQGIVITDPTRPDNPIVYASPGFERLTGYSQAESLGRNCRFLQGPRTDPAAVDRVRQAVKAGEACTVELLNYRKDGSTFYHELAISPVRDDAGRLTHFVAVQADVTARRQLQEERDGLLRRLQLHLDRMPLACVFFDADARVLEWNPAAERIFGYTRAEVLGRSAFETIVPESARADFEETLRRVRGGDMAAHHVNENRTKAGRAVLCEWFNTPFTNVRQAVKAGEACTVELLNYRKDGSTFYHELAISPVRDDAGRLTHFVAVQADVTARRQLQEERDGLLRRLQLHLDRMPLACVFFDADARVLEWNPAAERIFGYTRAEVLGRSAFETIVPESARADFEETLRRVRGGDMAAHHVNENRTKAGRAVLCEWFNTPFTNHAGEVVGCLSLAADITEKRSLEEQLRQAQKVEAVGLLAGGVAHDFNNQLTIINGCAELLLRRLPPEAPERGLVEEILRAGERSAALTQQLLAFSRRQVIQPRPLDLNEVVAGGEAMLRRVIGEDVQLRTVLRPLSGRVVADEGQLEQVLVNLAVNARDAMPRGGRLTIETAEADAAGPAAGPHVLLAVSDTGCGMPPEVQARVFEPFFTTKEAGKGTGLGLAVVHGVVQQAGGRVAVHSEVGVGTTFEVYLPCVASPAGPRVPQPALRLPPRGTETLLLVEDEDGVRALARTVLQHCGYTVLEAADGEEALRVAARHNRDLARPGPSSDLARAGHGLGPIALLVTDVVMPGLGGRPLAERLLALQPGMKVLYVSGYADDAVVRHGVLEEQVQFLAKPFTPLALACKVREVLDAPA
jgi:PAS domain S-box-containing protein